MPAHTTLQNRRWRRRDGQQPNIEFGMEDISSGETHRFMGTKAENLKQVRLGVNSSNMSERNRWRSGDSRKKAEPKRKRDHIPRVGMNRRLDHYAKITATGTRRVNEWAGCD